jgi:hypothetical protein
MLKGTLLRLEVTVEEDILDINQMSSSSVASSLSNVPFNTSLKVNPTLHRNKFHKELITFAASLDPDIIPSDVVLTDNTTDSCLQI